VPGETWTGLLGWLVATLMFAGFAGWVVADVWKEKTTQRAFFIGLALPYILWGFINDAQGLAQPRKARAQVVQSGPLGEGGSSGSGEGALALLKVEVVGKRPDGNALVPIPEATVAVHPVEWPSGEQWPRVISPPFVFPASSPVHLPRGTYEVRVSAPGWKFRRERLDLQKAQTLKITLEQATFWYDFWSGAKSVFLPHPSL